MANRWLTAIIALTVIGEAPAFAQHQHDEQTTAPTTAAAAHGSAYGSGLYLLHNFEYARAAEDFRKAQAADAGNVMAYWGEAMTFNHPLWAEQDVEAARAALMKLGPTPEARRAKARSEREGMWLDAVEALYGAGSKVERDAAYQDRMRRLFESDPADIDARTFYALATLGLAHGGRDTALYMRGAALLEEAFPQYPYHPGLLHYMIHAYDDPAHAPLGVRAAQRYATVAPDAGHAQHMISHIFLALGDWAEVERANVQADKVVDGQRTARGSPATSCGHYNEWLAYSLLQQGKDASALIDGCRAEAVKEATGPGQGVLGGWRGAGSSWSDMALRQGIETGQWPSAVEWPESRYLLGRFNMAYADLLRSRSRRAAAEAAVARMASLRDLIVKALPNEMPDEEALPRWLDRAVAQGEAVVALSADRETGFRLLREAAASEARLPVEFGPPALAKPSAELLADELLASGRKAEAAVAYRQVLAFAPGRRLSAAGLAAATR